MTAQYSVYALAGGMLVGFAFHALAIHTHVLKRILAWNTLGSAAFLVFGAIARRNTGAPDPVPHAIVITGIVVAISSTALALALARRIDEENKK